MPENDRYCLHDAELLEHVALLMSAWRAQLKLIHTRLALSQDVVDGAIDGLADAISDARGIADQLRAEAANNAAAERADNQEGD